MDEKRSQDGDITPWPVLEPREEGVASREGRVVPDAAHSSRQLRADSSQFQS